MNKLVQWILAHPETRERFDLAYYDRVERDKAGHFITPPSDI